MAKLEEAIALIYRKEINLAKKFAETQGRRFVVFYRGKAAIVQAESSAPKDASIIFKTS